MYGHRRPVSRGPSPMPPTGPISYATPLASSPIPSGDGMLGGMNAMPSAYGSMPQTPHTLRRPPSQAEFRVEKVARPPSSMGMRHSPPSAGSEVYFDENMYRQRVAAVLAAKDRAAFAATGYVFVEPSQMVLFFRSKSGITQSLDFPIDVEYASPPALDVLVSACRPHQTSDYNGYMERESLFYPPTLPLTTSLDLSSFPILGAVQNTLFPNLPPGHYLTASKDKLEVLLDGVRLERQMAHLRNDGRAATILVTLPVRFQGGAVLVRDPITGLQERFISKTHPTPPPAGGNIKESVEWVAFLANCDYETEVVEKGYRVMMSYGVYIKNYSSEGAVRFDSLSIPTDAFFDLLAPVMNMSRGRKIGFYLSFNYGVNPSLVTAQTLVPQLKGGDYSLYHAFKMYKLTPELCWAAGEYIWPSDRLVEFFSEDIETSPALKSMPGIPRIPVPYGAVNPPPQPGRPSMFGGYPSPPAHLQQPHVEVDPLRSKVEESGGQLFAEAGVTVMTDWNNSAASNGAVERVPFIAHGELQKFVVNVLLVVFVP